MAGRHTPSIEQAVMTDFIAEGHFGRHIRRMRTLYRERQTILVESLKEEAGGLIEVEPSAAGIHLVAWLREGLDDREVSREAGTGGYTVNHFGVLAKTVKDCALVLGLIAYAQASREASPAQPAVTAVGFSIGIPTMLPHSVQLPS